jgi:hypothetical protein
MWKITNLQVSRTKTLKHIPPHYLSFCESTADFTALPDAISATTLLTRITAPACVERSRPDGPNRSTPPTQPSEKPQIRICYVPPSPLLATGCLIIFRRTQINTISTTNKPIEMGTRMPTHVNPSSIVRCQAIFQPTIHTPAIKLKTFARITDTRKIVTYLNLRRVCERMGAMSPPKMPDQKPSIKVIPPVLVVVYFRASFAALPPGPLFRRAGWRSSC